MRKLAVAVLVLAVETALLAPVVSPVLAADAADLTAQGLRLRREGKDQAALPLLEEALRLQGTPRAFAQLGFVEQALGLWVAAESHLLQALKRTEDPWIRKNEQALRESLKVARERLGSIELWGSPGGARISLDGNVVGTLPIEKAARVTEGRHVLSAEAPNHLTESRVLNVRAGVLMREHIALAPAEEAVAAAEPSSKTRPSASAQVKPVAVASVVTTPEPALSPSAPAEAALPTWRRVLPWSLLAGAVVAGALGAWQQTVWSSGIDKFEAIPGCGLSAPMKGTDPRCQGLADDFSSARTRTFIGYGAAGALGLGAAALFIINATSSNDTTHAMRSPVVSPIVGRGEAGLSFAARF